MARIRPKTPALLQVLDVDGARQAAGDAVADELDQVVVVLDQAVAEARRRRSRLNSSQTSLMSGPRRRRAAPGVRRGSAVFAVFGVGLIMTVSSSAAAGERVVALAGERARCFRAWISSIRRKTLPAK